MAWLCLLVKTCTVLSLTMYLIKVYTRLVIIIWQEALSINRRRCWQMYCTAMIFPVRLQFVWLIIVSTKKSRPLGKIRMWTSSSDSRPITIHVCTFRNYMYCNFRLECLHTVINLRNRIFLNVLHFLFCPEHWAFRKSWKKSCGLWEQDCMWCDLLLPFAFNREACECFFAQVYFSNETVSQTTVSTGPTKMFHLDHKTMNVCQRNVARFVHV